jgi:lipopolysaccharide transport system permease protein
LGKFINLLLYRSGAELRSEGTRTYAGYLWWILEPLMSLGVYYFAFKYILQRETENFAIFLFIGIVIYRFFAGTVTRSASSILSGQGLMQLVYVHKSIFPLSVVTVNLVKFLITLLLVMVVTWLAGIAPTWSYLAMPILIALELLLTAGVSMVCAAITPFFPDFQLILVTLMHLLIFLSGVFFEIGTLSPRMQALIRLNPIAAVIEQHRAIILSAQCPNLGSLWPALLESIIFLAVGWLLIHKFNRYFPKLS